MMSFFKHVTRSFVVGLLCLAFVVCALPELRAAAEETTTETTTETTEETTTESDSDEDVAEALKYSISSTNGEDCSIVTDGDYTTYETFSGESVLTIKANETIQALYIKWESAPGRWKMEAGDQVVYGGADGFLHEYAELPKEAGDVKTVTVTIPEDGAVIADIYVLSEGTLPSWVQVWSKPYDQADILCIATHPDDEILWFGGLIADYVNEGDARIQVAYFTESDSTDQEYRNHELLDGLWYMGIDHYPQYGEFTDVYSESLEWAELQYDYDEGLEYIVRTIRRFKPQVVIGQDVDGEYGHGCHMLTSLLVRDAVDGITADASQFTDSAEKYGTWDVPKTYIHLYDENEIELDVDTPLEKFGGLTAFEVAENAYLFHESQQQYEFEVSDDDETNIRDFGLYRTTVGDDTGNDILENITLYDEQESEAKADANQIYTAEDLQKIKDDPSGSYVLMCDIDMAGIEWTPVDFTGTFDGNGHAILNLEITEINSDTRLSYDGNMISYDTYYGGLFGITEDAEIKNLSLLGVNVNVDTDKDVFVAGIAGYCDNTTIINCRVEGSVTLYVDADMFGVGGIAGYGNGSIKDSTADVTLICVDTNKEERDEQFMGGAYGAGYIDLENDEVRICGYDSDHGYVHDGGLVGMYILYPSGTEYAGCIKNNAVSGFINFFEDNTDRRAYCSAKVGEIMNQTYEDSGNFDDFERQETFEYDTDLMPHYCEDPTYSETVTEAGCDEYGYVTYTCDSCGWEYKADYTPRVHQVDSWSDVRDASEDTLGVKKGVCALCGQEVYETFTLEQRQAELESIEAEKEAAEAEQTKKTSAFPTVILIIIIVIAVIVIVLVVAYFIIKKKKEARRRAAQMRRKKRNIRKVNPEKDK